MLLYIPFTIYHPNQILNFMSLFNIYLENDLVGKEAKARKSDTIEGWSKEPLVEAEKATSTDDLRSMIKNFKNDFVVAEKKDDFQSAIVISKQVLDKLSQIDDFHGIRIYLCDNKDRTPENKQPSNLFLIMPVNSMLEDITGDSKDATGETAKSFFSLSGTGCPPREPSYCKGRATLLD